MSVEEYLRFENAADTKHEYVAGEVYAMSGVAVRHAKIVTNLVARLGSAARGGPCLVLTTVKCRTVDDRFYYPDVMVVCAPGHDDDMVRRDPCLVVEVTSPSTARIDRGEKLGAYRGIASLQAYLIVDHRRRRVDRHWRNPDAESTPHEVSGRGAGSAGEWRSEVLSGAGSVPVPCPEIVLTLEEIYEGVELAGVREPESAAYG
jgi:Uma2 family endonuclease